MSGSLTVALGTRTLDQSGSYSPVTLDAGGSLLVTQDVGTPVGDPVVVTLDGVNLGAGGTLDAENGATLVVGSAVSVAALSGIAIGPSGTVDLATGLGLSTAESISFTGPHATLGISGLSIPVGGSVTGFSASDTVDFMNVAAATSATYAGGVLTLLDGSTAVASLAVTGTVGAGQLAIQADGHGGYNVGDNVGVTTIRESGSMSEYVGDVSGPDQDLVSPTVATGDGSISPTEGNTVGFSNGIEFIDPAGTASEIARLYVAALGRAPELAGLTSWNTQVTVGDYTMTAVAQAIIDSPEAAARYGTLSNDQFVSQLYTNTGQTPDASAQQLVASLNAGATRGSVAVSVVNSAAAIVNNMANYGDNSAAEVYRLFEAGLGRDPEASGYAAFLPPVQSGIPLTDIANIILDSAEYAGKYGAPSNQDFLSEVYQNILGRAPDPFGQQSWGNQFAAGASRASVMLGILDSPEARADTAGATHQGLVTLS